MISPVRGPIGLLGCIARINPIWCGIMANRETIILSICGPTGLREISVGKSAVIIERYRPEHDILLGYHELLVAPLSRCAADMPEWCANIVSSGFERAYVAEDKSGHAIILVGRERHRNYMGLEAQVARGNLGDYFILTHRSQPGFAKNLISNLPDNAPASYRFREGEKLARKFPSQVVLRTTAQFTGASAKEHINFSESNHLPDFLDNMLGLLIASARVQALLKEFQPSDLEFLPVVIANSAGELVAAKGYAIINPLGGQDIVDRQKSECEIDDQGEIQNVDRLVLSTRNLGPSSALFRVDGLRNMILVREDLLRAFERAHFTGLRARKADGWDGLPILC